MLFRCIAHLQAIGGKIYLQTDVGDFESTISIASLEISAVSNDVLFQTLVSFCAFNGCDFESSFVAKGKGGVSNLLMKSVYFIKRLNVLETVVMSVKRV